MWSRKGGFGRLFLSGDTLLIELFTALISISWLMPNHYSPWLSAWGDGVAIAGLLLLLAALIMRSDVKAAISWQLLAITLLCCLIPCIQFAAGRIFYIGDVALVILYVGLWFAAVMSGNLLVNACNQQDGINWLMSSWAIAAVLSVAIALCQWTGAVDLGLYAADLPPGKRPFANVAQPNQFNTLCFFGLCGLLVLYQHRRLGHISFGLSAALLLTGMILSQSRTGWLQVICLLLWGAINQRRASLRFSKVQLVVCGLFFLMGTLALPIISNFLMLPVERTLDSQIQTSVRFSYWYAMAHALLEQPIWGYGWQQAGAAQMQVALDQPAIGIYFAHSHNLILDLLLWNGIPAGILITALLSWWFLARILGASDPTVVWLLAALGGWLIHSMLEFPHEYAYFLIPVGLAMGAIDKVSTTEKRLIYLSRRTSATCCAVLAVLFALTAIEYISVEENYRTQQLEVARIGVPGLITPVPELHLLTQLKALLGIAHVDTHPSMTKQQVESLREAAFRFGYPAILLRYSEALALNGDKEKAKEQMLILRSMWGEKAYKQAKTQMNDRMLSKYPEVGSLNLP